MRFEVYCEICNPDKIRTQPLGIADTDTLAVPMAGAMFESIDPDHGYPPPFHPSLDWEAMRCPLCRRRPFLHADQVKTKEGMYVIGGKWPGAPERVRPVYDDRELEEEWHRRMAEKIDRTLAMKRMRASGMSYAKIGKEFGVSGEWVRKLLSEEKHG